ncbi:MAG: hypothetical protein Q9207_007950 [Kuettlingeria erythrocarpa]
MTVLIDARRVSHMIHRMLLQQQSALDKFSRPPDICTQNIINMAVSNHSSPQSLPSVVHAQLSDIKSSTKRSTPRHFEANQAVTLDCPDRFTGSLGAASPSTACYTSCFLRGNFDIARLLQTRCADIEHVDSDGYSVLSYLWVVDRPLDKSVDFMRLCLANEFAEVNACDSRGWSAFQRAAAIGTPDDVEAFLQLWASLDLRAEWFGWTPLFFSASHDNVGTFETIVRHSPLSVYESLDGDGWTLLHCCIYFGAPRVVRMVLGNGLDVNQLTYPVLLPEDPELSYRELTPSDIALYIGPNRWQMFTDALSETGRDVDLRGNNDFFWDTTPDTRHKDSRETEKPRPIYGAEDVDDDRWTLLHWASYNGSAKVKNLLLLKGVDPEHMDAITLEENPTLFTTSPFEGALMCTVQEHRVEGLPQFSVSLSLPISPKLLRPRTSFSGSLEHCLTLLIHQLTMATTADFPAPHIVQPTEDHYCTIIALHPRGSTGLDFAHKLFKDTTSGGKTLAEHFLYCKWVFPSSPPRYSTVSFDDIEEWFNSWSPTDPTKGEEFQVEGLRDSVNHILGIIDKEVELVHPSNIVLLGLSQGCAVAVHALLAGRYRLGGLIGIAGWMPFRKQVMDAAKSCKDGLSLTKFYEDTLGLTGIGVLDAQANATAPVLLCYCADNKDVEEDLGCQLNVALAALGVDVNFRSFAKGGHLILNPEGFDAIVKFMQNQAFM